MQTKINGAILTNIGRKRTKNEDAAYFNSCEDFTLLMIADGIGGHKKGEVASDMTISIVSNKILNFEKAFKLTTSRRLIKNAIKYANKEVNNLSVKQEYLDMGTTLVLALVLKEKTIIANIGDSRLYRFDKEFGLTQLTVDQNYVQYMIQIGKMTKEEAIQIGHAMYAYEISEHADIESQNFDDLWQSIYDICQLSHFHILEDLESDELDQAITWLKETQSLTKKYQETEIYF